MQRPYHFARAVLCSPMAYINTSPLPHFLARAIAIARRGIGIGGNLCTGRQTPIGPSAKCFEGNRLTGDAGSVCAQGALFRDNPRLAMGSPTIGWLDAAYRSMTMVLTA